MESEKVKEIKELLRCMNGEKPCTNCYINEIAQEQETFCINVVADMTLELINELESENERLKKDNELLRNAKVVYETVDYCFEDLKKAEKQISELENIGLNEKTTVGEYLREMQRLKDRVAELEKEIEENAFYSKGYAQGIKNTYEVVIPDKLKQFAERLKEKLSNKIGYDKPYVMRNIDETLKEFIK